MSVFENFRPSPENNVLSFSNFEPSVFLFLSLDGHVALHTSTLIYRVLLCLFSFSFLYYFYFFEKKREMSRCLLAFLMSFKFQSRLQSAWMWVKSLIHERMRWIYYPIFIAVWILKAPKTNIMPIDGSLRLCVLVVQQPCELSRRMFSNF